RSDSEHSLPAHLETPSLVRVGSLTRARGSPGTRPGVKRRPSVVPPRAVRPRHAQRSTHGVKPEAVMSLEVNNCVPWRAAARRARWPRGLGKCRGKFGESLPTPTLLTTP